jgi:PST family polysaccharide transporter
MASSYSQILKSSSIMGSAQAINYLVGLLRVKAIAVLLGPAGVGVIGLYSTAISLLGTLTGLGLQGSAVRAIASSDGNGDEVAVGRTVFTLRRLCWITGLLGWVASSALAVPLSRAMFESDQHAWAIAILGSTLLISAVSSGQMATLQGLRRIGDIAKLQVIAAVVNTVLNIAIYAWLRERGIVPALIANAAVSLGVSWWFARRVPIVAIQLDWKDGLAEARPLLGLGLALTWSGALVLFADLFTRTLVSRELGLPAAGMYQASWALSGLFAGFILSAMGMDFYPRLTAVIQDRTAAVRAVNEQTEIGVLLALPGLLITLAFAKLVIWAFYSVKFAPAADVLVWMLLGMFGRVLSWPLGYILLALGASRWFVASEAAFHAVQILLVAWLVPRHGLVGAAYAFSACYFLHALGMLWLSRKLIGFSWSPETRRAVAVGACLMLIALGVNRLLDELPAMIVGCSIAGIGAVWSLRGLVERLDTDHPLAALAKKVPGWSYLAK